ncbi:MAG: hypothetical protein QXI32_05550 [Candidatus Bathyarchaeia archaeon]
MKKICLVAVVSLLALSMLSTVSVSGANGGFFYRASGKIEAYDKQDYTCAIIVCGTWNVRIGADDDGYYVALFNAHYQELNVNEEIPGTKDYFELYLTEITSVSIDREICTIKAHLCHNKKGWDPTTGKPLFTSDDRGEVTITISSSGIYFLTEYSIIGSTLSIQTKQ